MRNAFERGLGAQLKRAGVSFKYESLKLPYSIEANYYPDFVLDNGIIIEAKGILDRETKRKMSSVKRCHPTLDIRFVFYDAYKPIEGAKMSHGDWADKHGFPWAHKEIPVEWLK